MTKEDFIRILTEEGLGPIAETLWDSRPYDNLDEVGVRKAARETADDYGLPRSKITH